MTELRPELTPLPDRMRHLPLDRGYPVPKFVQWVEGKPEFRFADPRFYNAAILGKLCWVCGGKLGRYQTFVGGCLGGISRVSAEPPSHLECAEWAAKNCPFLARPHMMRREDERNQETTAPAGHSPVNSGVAMLWTTREWRLFMEDKSPLIEMGEPESVSFFREGRPATRADVEEAVGKVMPHLREDSLNRGGLEGVLQLEAALQEFQRWWPISQNPGIYAEDSRKIQGGEA